MSSIADIEYERSQLNLDLKLLTSINVSTSYFAYTKDLRQAPDHELCAGI